MRLRTRFLSAVAGLALAAPALADAPPALPLWELGLVGSAATLPDYPGADRNRWRVLPLPYAIYRGETLRAENGGVRGRYRFTPDVELDLSFGGALPADSDGNPARSGMPDLDLLLEIGPRLTLTLARPSAGTAVSVALPVRAVFSTDFSGIEPEGFITTPELVYTDRQIGGSPWRGRLAAGPVWATEPLMDYFYEVAPRFARSGRPAYAAEGGYLESRFTASLSRPLSRTLTLFLFARASSLEGATNDASPLLRERLNFAGGAGLAYTFRRSAQTVSSED